jgi:hypothetical protein
MNITKPYNMFRVLGKEDFEIEVIGGTIYAFGSEVGTLRLFKEYNKVTRNERTDQGFSKNLQKFYFRLELRHS